MRNVALIVVESVLLSQVCLLVRSQECSRSPPDGNDCSTVLAGECAIPTPDGFKEIMNPAANTRSCFRTCIRPDLLIGDTCEVNNISFENSTLPFTRPRNLVYEQWRIFSPNFNRGSVYRKSTICRYNVVCRQDQLLSFTLDRHNLEPPVACADRERCVDSLTLRRPIYGSGSISTTCGVVQGFVDFELSSLLVEFKTNRKIEDCGFRIFATCMDRALYFSQGCTAPNEPLEQKRKRREGLQNVFNIRTKKTFRKVTITVTRGAVVQYRDYTVRVIRGDRVLYRFPNTRVFQVFNRAERYLRFTRSGPEGRDFPGYGFLKIGRGLIYYIQEGVNPVFRPSPAEERIIQTMLQRLALEFDEDFDIADADDNPESPLRPPECMPTQFTPTQERLLREEAIAFGRACNGVLRATACAFQEVIMKKDCLSGSA